MNLEHYAPPPDDGLSLLYQDELMLAIDKPSGLLAVPGRGIEKQDCLTSRVQAQYPDALVVHRLDMGTSGIMLMARNKEIQAALGRQFEQRKVSKRYLAQVAGHPSPERGTIDLPLICDWPNRPRQTVDMVRGKAATTLYRVIGHDQASDSCLVELTPITGRSHQLRVHMSRLGHPILGDELYAPRAIREQSPRLLLHAQQLSLCHPRSGVRLTISSDCPFSPATALYQPPAEP